MVPLAAAASGRWPLLRQQAGRILVEDQLLLRGAAGVTVATATGIPADGAAIGRATMEATVHTPLAA
jgi:hypothetical protein